MAASDHIQLKEDKIEIQMLGDFTIRYGDKLLSGDKVRSRQIWNLLEYILVNRKNEISMDRLFQVLWKDDDVDDPANALKNLAYRLRNLLKKTFEREEVEFIVYKHGAYTWNPDIPCVIDADILESAFKSSKLMGINQEELLEQYKKIIDIYHGNFLPHSSYKEWVMPLTVYYQRIYMEAVEKFCTIMMERHDYKSVEEASRKAIAVDPFIETNHEILLKALIGSNHQAKALDHYNAICKLYYDELGVKPSDAITKLYKDIIDKNIAFEKDIAVIKDDLKENSHIKGAIYCNYEMFKMIYRLEARSALRTGRSIFIALLTVTGSQKKELSVGNLDETFEKLKEAIAFSLRKDDVVCRYGKTQFLLMLSNLTYENCIMVINRLISKINNSSISKQVEVYGQVQALEPVELEGCDA